MIMSHHVILHSRALGHLPVSETSAVSALKDAGTLQLNPWAVFGRRADSLSSASTQLKVRWSRQCAATVTIRYCSNSTVLHHPHLVTGKAAPTDDHRYTPGHFILITQWYISAHGQTGQLGGPAGKFNRALVDRKPGFLVTLRLRIRVRL